MTQPTDFRSLCAQFVDAVDLLCASGESPARPGERLILTTHVDGLEELSTRARAALAESQQGAPGDEAAELSRWLAFEADNALAAGRHFPASMLTSASEMLAHYGAQAVPVAVGERLPGEGDSLKEISNWILRCQEDIESNRWAERVEHHDALAIAAAALHDLSSHPAPVPVGEPDVDRILDLAAIIRQVDGNHDKGAAALAEAILSHPNIGSALAAPVPVAAPQQGAPTLGDVHDLCEETGFVLGIDGANEAESAEGLLEIVLLALSRYGTHPAPVHLPREGQP